MLLPVYLLGSFSQQHAQLVPAGQPDRLINLSYFMSIHLLLKARTIIVRPRTVILGRKDLMKRPRFISKTTGSQSITGPLL